MKNKIPKKYFLICEVCSYKQTVDNLNDFTQVGFVGVQRKMPKLEDGKVAPPPIRERDKKIKCPKCGRLVNIRPVNE